MSVRLEMVELKIDQMIEPATQLVAGWLVAELPVAGRLTLKLESEQKKWSD